MGKIFSFKSFMIFLGVVALLGGGLLKWMTTSQEDLPELEDEPSMAATAPVVSTTKKSEEVKKPKTALPKPRRMASRGKVEERFRGQFEQIGKLLQNRQPKEAIKVLQDILKKDPNNERALEEMGMIYMTEFQNPGEALGYFQKVVSLNPNNEFAVMELVGLSTHPEKAGQTLEYLRSMYDSNSGSAALADGIGELMMSQGRFNEAIPYLEKSAEDPKYAEFAHSRIASVYQQMGETDKAIESYQKAIGHQESQISERQSKGQPTEMMELDKARSELELARILISQGKSEEAERLIDDAGSRLGNNDWEVDSLREEMRRLQDR